MFHVKKTNLKETNNKRGSYYNILERKVPLIKMWQCCHKYMHTLFDCSMKQPVTHSTTYPV